MSELSFKKRIGLEIARSIKENRKKFHVLSQLFWESTLRCNLRCRHCGSACLDKSQIKDMPPEDFLKAVDSITPHVDPHHTLIIITGGEPLLRQDLGYVGKELYKRGYPWGMVTNGMLLTEKKLASLLQNGLRSVTVSLDGNEEDHNFMRGNPKSWQKAFEAIKLIANTPGLVYDVASCITPHSLPGLDELKDKLFNAGVKYWRVFSAFPAGRAKDNPDLQLNGAQMRELMEFIKKCRSEGKRVSFSCEGFLGRYESEVRDSFYSCEAGVSVASVMSDGSISACPGIRAVFSQGNIYKDDFWDVWENRFQKYRVRDWAKKGKCAGCRFWRFCEGGGMHLHNADDSLMMCHLERLNEK
jgi:radical SAM enzyme (rSAM/lipoprotein system)